jgi:N-acetylneuraminic acid mutarotase
VGQRLGALPHKRGAAAVATGGTIYLLGGTQRTAHSGRIPVGSVLRIDGPGERTRVAKLPTPVTGAAAAAVGDRLYAIGGRLANGKTTNEVQEYDVATEHSVIAARLPEGVAQASAVTLDGFVYVLGGDAGTAPSASILRFDPWADAVAPAGRLPATLVGGAAAAFRPHHAYLVGATGPGSAHAPYSLTLKPGRG